MAALSRENSWESGARDTFGGAKQAAVLGTPTGVFDFLTSSAPSTSGTESALDKASRSSEAAPAGEPERRVLDDVAEEIAHVDVDFVVARLTTSPLPLTGQVVAYCWEQAALLSTQRRVLPTQLTVALWPATAACLDSLDGEVR